MNKEELIRKYASLTGDTIANSRDCVAKVLEAIVEGLKETGEVKINGFGVFSLVEKDESIARNPKTGEEIVVAPHKVCKFKFSKALKDSLR